MTSGGAATAIVASPPPYPTTKYGRRTPGPAGRHALGECECRGRQVKAKSHCSILMTFSQVHFSLRRRRCLLPSPSSHGANAFKPKEVAQKMGWTLIF